MHTATDGGTGPDRPIDYVDKAFDPAVRTDILNSLLIGLVRRSHILLYAEDAWSEGYSAALITSAAAEAGAVNVPLDIPDWSLMTSHIDPILEDLTIVCHPYTPPPDLMAHGRDEGSGSMSFFANINRERPGDEGDVPTEQDGPWEDEEAEGAHDREGQDVDADDAGTQAADRRIDAIRSRLGPGKWSSAGGSSQRGEPAEEDAGDPVLSREMMTNPLSREATELLDRVLSDFASTPKVVDGIERPRVIVVKHLGDLLNTRIGYTLFSRLVAAVTRHNSNLDALPVVVAGLMHPSLFHPEVPPPSIPPFDVNPATPVALMPKSERSTATARGIGDILEGFLGGSGGQRAAGSNVGVQVVHMDGVGLGNRVPRAQGASAPPPVQPGGGVEELPLFARIGIPPPARSVLLMPCNMQSPLRATPGADATGQVLVGSLRQAMVADQCMERNARVIRNICLLYRIPELELNRAEADYLRQTAGGAGLEATSCEDGGLTFYRRPLYAETGTPIRSKQQRRGGWYLDHRPLVAMLQSLPDDVGRRYFFAESFLHRWISLAQALSVRERTSLEAIRRNPALLTEAGRGAVLSSQHLRAAWSQFLESFVALRHGVVTYQPEGSACDTVAEGPDDIDDSRAKEPHTEARVASILPLHRQVDFDEIGVGHRVEDIMDIESEATMPNGAPAADPCVLDSDGGSDGGVQEQAAQPPAQPQPQPQPPVQPQPVRWADIAYQLEPLEQSSGFGAGSDGTRRAAPVQPPQKRIQLAKKSLTEYEQRLMGSVIDPLSIPTGFGHVCVKDETVTTLQEIITLPMLRPEYFSKGVLRRYGVSGILLFGPPGTGKTMLAKAVAKESGSVVLNIRASDVYDKYVGEGEKLAEAVFTLARKLAPCVIFIDEVDALFSARSSGEANKFRRDIMNQIMSEWDGVNTSRKTGKPGNGPVDKSGAATIPAPPPQVMVMAATNRPFDLDDAILRRLPRRILVDLPDENDRARILEIHLKGEELDADVDLHALAKRTESFSGSDLKNVCVAAAQAALRERVRAEVAASVPRASGDEAGADGASGSAQDALSVPLIEKLRRLKRLQPGGRGSAGVVPIKLAARHFDTALKKVAPSSSDQMESLVELRKWDRIYGDGAQERKRKVHAIGFAGAAPDAAKAGASSRT
ncbi:hypothetical protein LPJ61_003477 [Coemansia biformis]|uniref:AAA+ ATPase domain-containing protein n=1 Tax=Coemansia biformis TaxID=1286918 RepID=A0A9W7YB51_9FUNG|nr:hypothetical protein LPJ61_003477 [Coemansia biformis]